MHYIDKESGQLSNKDIKEIKDNAEWANKPRVKCKNCGDVFPANSNRQKYCGKCKKIVRKEKLKERNKK